MTSPSETSKWHRYLRFWKRDVVADVDDEIAFHLDARAQELIAAGAPADAAQAQAVRDFGDVEGARGVLRDMDRRHFSRRRRAGLFADLWLDARVAARSLRASPGFVLVVVLTLAVGIGLNSAVYSVVDAYLFRPMDVPHGRDLIMLGQTDAALADPHELSYPNYADIRADTSVFAALAGVTTNTVNLAGDRAAERVWVQETTANFFDVLGVRPFIGRLFEPDDDKGRFAHPVIVLSHAFWKSRFGENPRVIGDTLSLNHRVATIIGVTPPGFYGSDPLLDIGVFAPLNQVSDYSALLTQRGNGFMLGIGRLAPGVTVARANAAVRAISRRLEDEYPASNRNVGFAVVPEMRARPNIAISGNVPRIALAFMLLVSLVLVVACANVASLLLARGATQQKERAIRAALGAGEWQLARRVLIECVILAGLGAAGAIALARWAIVALTSVRIAADVPIRWTVALDGRVVAFTAGISLLTAMIAAVAPALSAGGADVLDALKSGGRSSGGASQQRLRSVLVIAQIAVSLVVLVCAALFARSTSNALRTNLGFRSDKLLMASVSVGAQGYDSLRGKTFHRELLRRVSALPGVRAAAFSRYTPLGYNNSYENVYPDASPLEVPESGFLYFNNVVSPLYFAAMGIPILEGRAFLETDDERADKVAVVTKAFAATLWPGQSAVGKRFRFSKDGPRLRIVGVSGDIQYFAVGEQPKPFFFRPWQQWYQGMATLDIWTENDPAAVAQPVRTVAGALDPTLPVFDIRSITDHLVNGRALIGTRIGAAFAAVFAALALILAAVGVYGLISYSVVQRTREIGIRVALGAERSAVVRMVVTQGARVAVMGVAAGLAVTLLVTQLLANLLYDVAPRDPVILGAVAAALAAIALIASLVPARRATRVDPLVALRAE